MQTLPVKTYNPDYRFQDFDSWKRHIVRELFLTSVKVDWIRASEIIQPRIKIMA